MTALEADIKAAVLKALAPLEAAGRCIVIRQQAGTRSGGRMRLAKPGTPDIQVLIDDGRTAFLELKRPGRYTRAKSDRTQQAQAAWRAKAERLGHRVYVVQSAQDAVSVVLGDAPTPRDYNERTGAWE